MSRLLPRFDRRQQEAEDARKLARILLETGAALPTPATSSSSAAGDPHKLRGLPAVGVRGGLGGAIAGTKPGVSRSLDDWTGRTSSQAETDASR